MRTFLRWSLALACTVALGAGLGAALAEVAQGGATVDPNAQVVKVVARRFFFTPHQIVVKKGQPVVFELTTMDFGHGFNIPDFDFRADFIPEKVNRVPFRADKAGKFPLLCDNFCGSGHEQMEGSLLVEE